MKERAYPSRRACSKCGKIKSIIAFALFTHRDGGHGRRGICRECRDQYQHDNFKRLQRWRRAYNKKNKKKKVARDHKRRAEARAFLDAYKKGKPCTDCGNMFPPVAMDFDHIKGGKQLGVSTLAGYGYSIELIKAEIAKCELVCACCHRVRTAKRGHNLAPTLRQLPSRRPTAPRSGRQRRQRH